MKKYCAVIIALALSLVLGALAIFSGADNTVLQSNIHEIQPCYKTFINRAADYTAGNEDFLLAVLGTDERANEISRSDVIMLIKYNAEVNKVIIVSVPRDCKVPIPGKGKNKINAAYAFGGAKLQVSVLEELFDVKNVRYIHINFEGFKNVIDTLGGVEINAEKDFEEGNEIFIKKGPNILKGDDLLAYVRYRHDIEGDFGRIKRQQEVISSLASSVLKPENIAKLPKLALLVAKNSDSDMDIFFIMNHIEELKKLESLQFEFYTLNTASEKSNGIWYEIIDEEDLESISELLQD
ncbi:MAG: lytR [Clostridia bacterium]|jgi:LCP family protein required for cell wall assembly|nr:lytR [Clostridia bacterium]